MKNFLAFICTILTFVLLFKFSIWFSQTGLGHFLLVTLNNISFILGLFFVFNGAKNQNFIRLGLGILLFCSSIGDFSISEPLNSGFQLFAAIAGAFVNESHFKN